MSMSAALTPKVHVKRVNSQQRRGATIAGSALLVGSVACMLMFCAAGSVAGGEEPAMDHNPESILARAVEMSEELDRTYEKDVVFQLAALMYLEAGRLSHARRLVNKISHEDVRAMGRYSLATALIKLGRMQEAVATVADGHDDHYHDLFRVELMAAQIKAGDQTGAWQTFSQIQDWWFKALGWVTAGDSEVEPSALKAAMEAARNIDIPGDRAWGLAGLAVAQAGKGDAVGATEIAKGIANEDATNFALWGIGSVQAKKGDLQGALRTIAGLKPHQEMQALALAEIAKAQVQQGKVTEALTSASWLPNADDRWCVQHVIVHAQAKGGDSTGALKVALSIEDERRKHLAWHSILVEQAEQGHIDPAVRSALAMDDDFRRGYALHTVALVQAGRGDYQGAQATFAKVPQRKEAAQEFIVGLAGVQACRGDVAQALAWTDKAETPFQKARILLAVAGGMMGKQEGPLFEKEPSCGKRQYVRNIFY